MFRKLPNDTRLLKTGLKFGKLQTDSTKRSHLKNLAYHFCLWCIFTSFKYVCLRWSHVHHKLRNFTHVPTTYLGYPRLKLVWLYAFWLHNFCTRAEHGRCLCKQITFNLDFNTTHRASYDYKQQTGKQRIRYVLS